MTKMLRSFGDLRCFTTTGSDHAVPADVRDAESTTEGWASVAVSVLLPAAVAAAAAAAIALVGAPQSCDGACRQSLQLAGFALAGDAARWQAWNCATERQAAQRPSELGPQAKRGNLRSSASEAKLLGRHRSLGTVTCSNSQSPQRRRHVLIRRPRGPSCADKQAVAGCGQRLTGRTVDWPGHPTQN